MDGGMESRYVRDESRHIVSLPLSPFTDPLERHQIIHTHATHVSPVTRTHTYHPRPQQHDVTGHDLLGIDLRLPSHATPQDTGGPGACFPQGGKGVLRTVLGDDLGLCGVCGNGVCTWVGEKARGGGCVEVRWREGRDVCGGRYRCLHANAR